jgi:GDPmannose 4,6-dehydratase
MEKEKIINNYMKAIIFGSNGQDGYYLSNILQQNKVEVIGIDIKGRDCLIGDITDYAFVTQVIKKYQPNYIFHFAAISSTKHEHLFANHQIICEGTNNILESVRLECPTAKVFLSGSAMQFENKGKPIAENAPFQADSCYSAARIYSVYLGRYFREKFGIQVYVGYFFNHDSSLRAEQHVNMKIVQAVKRISRGSTEKIELGNIDVKKEFNFAGDIMEAIWLLVNQDKVYEAVIGSGKAYSIKDFIAYSFKQINKNWKDHLIIKSDYVPEYSILVSNPRLIKSLGWKPKHDFYRLTDLMLKENK